MKKALFKLSDFDYEAVKKLTHESNNQKIILDYGIEQLEVNLKTNPFLRDYTSKNKSEYFYDENTNFFLTLSEEYATIQFSIDNTDFAAVTYREKEKMQQIWNIYDKNLPEFAREFVKIGASGDSLLMNITKIVTANPQLGLYKYIDNLYKKDTNEKGKGNIIMLHIIKDATQYPMEHEVEWQLNNIMKSLNFLNNTYFGLYRYESEFRGGSEDAHQTLLNFQNWVRENYSLADYDCFFLVRWGGWKNGILGMAFLDSYNVNKYRHPDAYGISCTTCLYPWVFGHEMGHILGADHVNDGADIMYPQSICTCTGRHRNEANINKIKQNGTYIPDNDGVADIID